MGCSKRHEPNSPIKIAISIWPGYAHAFIAQEKGFFEKNGVQVELIFEKDYIASQKNYSDGYVDGVFQVYADSILQASEGLASRIVYVADFSINSDVIVGKPELKNLSSLKGKIIGIAGINTFSNLFVISVLEKSGMKEQEVRFKVIPALDVPEALDRGLIDAGHTWDPAKSLAIKKGYKILAEAQYVPGLIADVLVFNAQMIEKRPREIKAILKALFEAQDFIQNNHQEAIKIMSKYQGISTMEMEESLGGFKQLDLKENIQVMQKSNETSSLYGSGKVFIDFYLKRGQLSHTPDLDRLIVPRFLEELESK
jgi:NitT/TauT family transport system substrate-binding protein